MAFECTVFVDFVLFKSELGFTSLIRNMYCSFDVRVQVFPVGPVIQEFSLKSCKKKEKVKNVLKKTSGNGNFLTSMYICLRLSEDFFFIFNCRSF